MERRYDNGSSSNLNLTGGGGRDDSLKKFYSLDYSSVKRLPTNIQDQPQPRGSQQYLRPPLSNARQSQNQVRKSLNYLQVAANQSLNNTNNGDYRFNRHLAAFNSQSQPDIH